MNTSWMGCRINWFSSLRMATRVPASIPSFFRRSGRNHDLSFRTDHNKNVLIHMAYITASAFMTRLRILSFHQRLARRECIIDRYESVALRPASWRIPNISRSLRKGSRLGINGENRILKSGQILVWPTFTMRTFSWPTCTPWTSMEQICEAPI